MGCGSSKQDVEEANYSLYALPRRYIDDPEEGRHGRSEFPRYVAEDIIERAPRPSHNKRSGRRPHAHYDYEEQFTTERAKLKPLEGVRPPGSKDPPVLWAYPATYYNYEGQNRHGMHKKGRDLSPGPHRIITDKDKNIQGMVTHPIHSRADFVRAPERVRVVQRPKPRR